MPITRLPGKRPSPSSSATQPSSIAAPLDQLSAFPLSNDIMPTLGALPNEILSLVSSHLDRPRDVLNLALSSRRLHEYTDLDGWKAFLKGRFGLAGFDDARNAVHGMTTLCRNWDRKAFVARHLEPASKIKSLNSWEDQRWRGPRGQTMGYQPKIDSYEETLGSWTDRREVLAWSAGTQVIMRTKETGNKAATIWRHREELDPSDEHIDTFNDFRHLTSWYTYKIPQSSEGRDDITALKLLRPHQKSDNCDGIAFGSASGHLSVLRVDTEPQKLNEQKYVTEERIVGSLSVSSASNPLMAANLGDTAVALYPIHLNTHTTHPQQPLSQVTSITSGSRNGRLWSCEFLSNSTVAVGLGPSYEPIQVYEVSPTGFSVEPIRRFSLDSKFWGGGREGTGMTISTSVYPILPIPADAQVGSEGGNTFLSGGYDGIIRLHDMRSPHGFETMFWDVTNDSSIYSLALQGLERVVAGTSMHSMLKVFDLRLSGSHMYHSLSMPQQPKTTPTPAPKSQDMTFNSIASSSPTAPTTGGWNLYLNPRDHTRSTNHLAPHTRTADSPVYSLSIPSPTSPSLYCGIEGAVMDLTFLSILDPNPDPLLSPIIHRFPDSNKVDVKRTYNPSDDVLNLGMYEQGNEDGLGMQLMVQDGVGMGTRRNSEKRDSAKFRGLDERWRNPGDEADRWSRGMEPDVLQRGGGQRGGGRWTGNRGGRGGRGRGQRGGRGVGGLIVGRPSARGRG